MKANELMIGDWMFIKDYPIKALPQKVKPEHFVRSLVEFEPIPLTPEVLEKNGFSNKNTLWYLEKGNFELEHNNNDSFIWIVGDVYIVAFIKYVHQLQHAFRLCGIEKEIVI